MKILVLAGTAEARELCARLRDEGHDVEASLAGETRKPLPLGVKTRVGGFGGVEGLQAFLDHNQIEVLIDGTHPFADQMTANALAVSVHHHAILQREAWVPSKGDSWFEIGSAAETADYVKAGQNVLLATGRKTIHDFAVLGHAYCYARVLDEPNAEYPFNGEYLWGRPPFSAEDEIALFKDLKIDWIVVKNAGGPNSVSKLDAARELGIPVLMLKRPDVPSANVKTSVGEMMEWVNELG